MKLSTIYRINDGVLAGTEIEPIMGFISVKYPHRKTKDLYIPPMEANGKKVETFHCCQENCKQPDFGETIDDLVKHLELHMGRLVKKLHPVNKQHPAIVVVKLPPNEWVERLNCDLNKDRQFVVGLYKTNVVNWLRKQGIEVITSLEVKQ
jgi:hypothetical protein